MVNLPPVDVLIYTRDESSKGGIIHETQEHDGLMTGGTAVDAHGEEPRGKDATTGPLLIV